MSVQAHIKTITERIIKRSEKTRRIYLDRAEEASRQTPLRGSLSCGNLAHVAAACPAHDKTRLVENSAGNLGIITAYNDMLSAHQPFERFPELIRQAAREAGGTAQVAGGVPAMCDGVTQGQPGMELSLFSRDVIAMAAGISLSHNAFDAVVCLGVCDKIVPGLVMGVADFGHLPVIFLPAGPMVSGLPNDEKAKVRQQYAAGEIKRGELLEAEMKSYHAPGTCTFYGTANTNQMLMEFMGLHLPGASFVNPGTPLRDALTRAGAKRALQITASGSEYTPICEVLDERAFVNGIVGLHATGGSTNLTLHLIAMAQQAGIQITWQDMAELSELVPLLARVYPNGFADVNHFHAAGGLGFLICELLNAGLLHEDVMTISGKGLEAYTKEPALDKEGGVVWQDGACVSLDAKIVRSVATPFQKTGGLKVLTGNLGQSVIKTSAVAEDYWEIEAPARVFHSQEAFLSAFKADQLLGDMVCVVRFQGPKAIGMPELHALTPPLSVMQARGHKVALVTDGRMSGASGKVPAAIHLSPEALDGGMIAKIHDGDLICLDARKGTLDVKVSQQVLDARTPACEDLASSHAGCGRGLFSVFRKAVAASEKGASVFQEQDNV